jgi:hypothetical protein
MREPKPEAVCKNCGWGIYLYEGRWRHTMGLYVCPVNSHTLAEPREASLS